MAHIWIVADESDALLVSTLASELAEHAVESHLLGWRAAAAELDKPSASPPDYRCVAVTSSRRPEDAEAILDRMLQEEASSGVPVLPLVFALQAVPEVLERRKFVDFSVDPVRGLRQLLATFGRIRMRKFECGLSGVRVLSARRGVPERVGSMPEERDFYGQTTLPSRLAVHFVRTRGRSVLSLVESVGTLSVALELHFAVAASLMSCVHHSREVDVDPEALVRDADQAAKRLNEEHGLTGSERVSCKLSLLFLEGETARWFAIGNVGLVTRQLLAKDEWQFLRLGQHNNYTIDLRAVADDSDTLWARAPVGHLLTTAPLEIPAVELRLEHPSEFIGLTSFALPCGADLDAFWHALLRQSGPEHLARTLATSHLPTEEDSIACAIWRDQNIGGAG